MPILQHVNSIELLNSRFVWRYSDMDPVDRTSCCEEFKEHIYSKDCCKHTLNQFKQGHKRGKR